MFSSEQNAEKRWLTFTPAILAPNQIGLEKRILKNIGLEG